MKFTPYTTLEEALAGTEYIVEANSYERLSLWKEYSKTNTWEQNTGGWLTTVGSIHDYPVVISTFWDTINGKLVLFYHPTSKVVDCDQISFYLETKCKGIKSCDASNFHQCIQFTKG